MSKRTGPFAKAFRRAFWVVVLVSGVVPAPLSAMAGEMREAFNSLVVALNARLAVAGHMAVDQKASGASVSQGDLNVLRGALYDLMEQHYVQAGYECAGLAAGAVAPCMLVSDGAGAYTSASYKFLDGNGGDGYLYTVLPGSMTHDDTPLHGKTAADGVPLLQVHFDELARAINALSHTAKSAAFQEGERWQGNGHSDKDSYSENFSLSAAFAEAYGRAVADYGIEVASLDPPVERIQKMAWYYQAGIGYYWPAWQLATVRANIEVTGLCDSYPHQATFYAYVSAGGASYPAFPLGDYEFRSMGDAVSAGSYNTLGQGGQAAAASSCTSQKFPPSTMSTSSSWATSADGWYQGGWEAGYPLAVLAWSFPSAQVLRLEPVADPEADGIIDQGSCACTACSPQHQLGFPSERQAASGSFPLGASDTTNALAVRAYVTDCLADGEHSQMFSLDTGIVAQASGTWGESVTVARPSGASVAFFFISGSAVGKPLNGNSYRLVKMTNGTFELHFGSGRTHKFNSEGRLASVRSSVEGKEVTLSGSGSNWPELTVTRNAGQITRVESPLLVALPVYTGEFITSVQYKTNTAVAGAEDPINALSVADVTIDNVAYTAYEERDEAGALERYQRVHQTADSTVIERCAVTNGVAGDVLERRTRTESSAGATRTLTDTTTTIDPGTAAESTVSHASVYTTLPWGEELTASIRDWGGAGKLNRTTSYLYYTDRDNDGANYSHLKCEESPDGSWTLSQWDADGRKTKEVRPFGNTAKTAAVASADFTGCEVTTYGYTPLDAADTPLLNDHRPRAALSTINGTTVSQRYLVYKADEDIEYQCQTPCAGYAAAVAAADTLITRTAFYPTGHSFAGRAKSVLHPDGTVTLYSYSLAGTTLTTTTETGAGTLTAVSDGTRTVTAADRRGTVSVTTVDIDSGIAVGQTDNTFDGRGRVTCTDYLDGTFTTTAYACCGPATVTDREGIVTEYAYDEFARLLSTTRNGIWTIYASRDVHGNVVQTVRIGTDSSSIEMSTAQYDDAGRLTATMDALDNTTTIAYGQDAEGHSARTTTYPDGHTRIETSGRDGRLISVFGTADHPVRYEYGIDADGRFTKTVFVGDNGAEDEWVKSYTDLLGRECLTVWADEAEGRSWYSDLGQPVKQTDPDGVTTLYTYNDRGERRDTAIDMDQDGAIDYDGADRITRATSEVRAARGTSVRRTQTYEWRTDGTDASTLVNTMDVSVNGLDSWSESFGRTSHSQTVYNRATATRTVTTTAPDGSHGVTEYQNGRLVSVTRYDAADTQLGQTMYAYDAHGRQQSVTDARTGATLFTYDDADQVATVTSPDPDGAGTQTAQVTSYTYDVRGRTSQVTLPDSGIVNHSYWPTGELRKTWGTRVYPTESTYDAQGRLQTLTTWKDYAGNGGEAVTTWNYNDDRGWLDSKHYADGKGPSYTHSTGGRLLSRAWARLAPGNQQLTTAYSYNGAGDPVGIDYSDSTPDVTFGYDRAGRAVTITDAAGTQTLAYTEDSQLDAATYAAGGLLAGISLDAGFDILGRRTSLAWSATAGSGSTAYAYDAASRLATVSSGAVSFAYGYLPNSDLVATVTASNGTQDVMDTNRAYDQISRLTAITSTRLLAPTDTLTSFTYAYNAANQRIQSTLADGSYWIYEYDALGQVTSAVKHWAGGAPVAGQTFGYAFDDIGNRETAMEGEAPSHASAYSANALNQYTQRTVPALVAVRGEAEAAATVTVTVGAPAPAGTTYPADRYGRSFRALVPVGNTESAVWQDLQIVGVRPGAGPEGKDMVSEQAGYAFVPESPEAFTHDDDGNLLSDGRWQYTWDAENRLVAMETRTNLPASIPRLRLELAYDSQSRRVRKKVYSWTGAAWSTSSDTRFVYDGWNLLAEIDSTGAPLRSYVWGLDLSGSLQGAGGIGGLLCITQHSTPATRHLPSYDGNGNLVVLVDAATGAPVAQYEYDPFGNPLRVTGASAGTNPFRFSTKYTDAETGLVYYGYRYLNTGTGRWLNRDPLEEGGGVSLYGLCGNAPVAAADALGLERRWSGGYEVTGTGHHVFPVELWRDFGFPDSVKPILDQATISVDPGRLHNSYAHGRINGYTGYVTVYANDVMAKWLTERGLTGRHLIQCQYEELAQLLVAKLQPASCTDEFIRGFNARVHSPGRLTDWYERAGSRLPRVAEEARTLRKLPGSARVATSRVREVLGRAMDIGRRIPGLEYILAATALWSYSARGDSGEDAAMKTVLDTLLPVVSVADIEDAGAAVFADPYEGAAGVGQGQFSGGQGGVWGDVARNRRQVLDLENQ